MKETAQGSWDDSCDVEFTSKIKGCLIRDSLGNWPHGFAGHIHGDEVVQAKLMGIFKGLQLVWDMGFRNVILYSDSTYVLFLINKTNSLIFSFKDLFVAFKIFV